MSTTPTPLANPNQGVSDFIQGIQDAGMADAVEAVKLNGGTPTEEPPKKEVPPVETPKVEPVKETPKEVAKEVVVEDEKKWPRTAKDWDAYKKADKERLEAIQKERDEIKSERDRVREEIESLKKTGPSPELEALKKERDELDKQLRISNVERHPKFKAHFENRTNAEINRAKQIVGTERAAEIESILKSPDGPIKDRQLEELFESMTSVQQVRLGNVVDSLSRIGTEREAAISAEKENYETLVKQEQEQVEAKKNQFTSLFNDTVKEVGDLKNGSPAFQKRDGDEVWNKQVDQRIETAKNLMFGSPEPKALTKAVLDAVAYPAVLQMVSTQMQQIQSLEAQVKELSAAGPRVDSNTPSTETTTSPLQHAKHTDPMSAATNFMKGLPSLQ